MKRKRERMTPERFEELLRERGKLAEFEESFELPLPEYLAAYSYLLPDLYANLLSDLGIHDVLIAGVKYA